MGPMLPFGLHAEQSFHLFLQLLSPSGLSRGRNVSIRAVLIRFLLLDLILIHSHLGRLGLSTVGGVSPLALDAELDGLMTNPAGGNRLIIGKELLPGLGDQVEQVMGTLRLNTANYSSHHMICETSSGCV